MRENAFRPYLARRVGATSVASYLSNLRAIERLLEIDLDAEPLSADAIATMCLRLRNGVMPDARASDCGSALRQYASFRDLASPLSLPVEQAPRKERAPPATPRSAFVMEAGTADLMRLYADVLAELRTRGVLRTANGPVGDYGEYLFQRAFNWTLAKNSAAYHDATDAADVRYQIKGRRVGGAGSRQLGILRRLPEAQFDILAAVLFDRDMQVLRAALIPHRVVVERARYVAHTNGWRFILDDAVWSLPLVRDATTALRTAAGAIG